MFYSNGDRGMFVNTPNVRFNNSHGNGFTNPAAEVGGVSNPNPYSNVQQPNVSPYDNIPEKSEIQNPSETPASHNAYVKF